MGQEVELKLTLPEAEQRAFLRSKILRSAPRSSEHLLNIYYDTPDLALQCNGIALRLRRNRNGWLQTVKCAGLSVGALSSRPEWETHFPGQFDFDAIDDPTTRKRLQRLKARLMPIFETHFRRTTWTVRLEETELLVALDRGTIAANGNVDAISEVEIELAAGRAERIFACAGQLAQDFSLTPGLWSKAERGYRLFLGMPQTPARAVPAPLNGAMSPSEAFRRIADTCLDQLQLNHAGALQSEDAEYFHQMRVALRRLRAALRLFAPALPSALDEQLAPHLRALMRALGNARDLDVLAEDIVAPVARAISAEPRIAALADLIAERRQAARRSALQTLRAPEYGRTQLLAMSLLHSLPDQQAKDVRPLAAFANARLRRELRKVTRLSRAVHVENHAENPASLHALRIAAKRLRYALEFFAPLMPARRTATHIKRLARLQDTLGQLNDLANAGTLLMDCAGDNPGLREAVSLIGGWHGQRYRQLLARIPHAQSRLETAQLPEAE